jgi:hypothetical protein
LTPQTDAISRAVAYNGNGTAMSPCYTAVVYAWYQDITTSPYAYSGDGGSIVQIAEEELTGRAGALGAVPKYWFFDPGVAADPTLASDGPAWCAAFASYVYHAAGVPNFVPSASVTQLLLWGMAHNTAHAVGSGYVPHPGDLALVNATPIGYSQHVEIVETVLANGEFTTIAGNSGGSLEGAVTRNGPLTAASEQINWFVSPGTYPAATDGTGSTGSTGATGATGASG